MIDPKTQVILTSILSPDKSVPERIQSLVSLADFLQDEFVATELIKAARREKSTDMRRALLSAALTIDVTRLTNRADYFEHVLYFAEAESQPDIRLLAVNRLVRLAPMAPEAEVLLADLLVYELDENIQRKCLEGLAACVQKTADTMNRMIQYAPHALPEIRQSLIPVFDQFPRDEQERGYLALLDPAEPADIRSLILQGLARLISLSDEGAKKLVNYLSVEPQAAFQEQAAAILADRIRMAPGLMEAVAEQVKQSPYQARLLEIFRHRLFSFPEIRSKLVALFGSIHSAFARIEILDLLGEADSEKLLSAAVEDPNAWVRQKALDIMSPSMKLHPAELTAALAERIPNEPLADIRARMIGMIGLAGRKEAAVERALLIWTPKEKDPRAAQALAAVLPGIVITDENRTEILQAYLAVLKEPIYPPDIQTIVTQRLQAFSYRDEPALIGVLAALLARSTDMIEVQKLDDQLRTLDPNPAHYWPVRLRLFYRFIGQYPQHPLDRWLKEFKDLAPAIPELQSELTYLRDLTGDASLVSAASSADQKAAFLPAMERALQAGEFDSASLLLNDAYKNRVIRKSDLVSLYRKLLNFHSRYPLLQDVIKIMMGHDLRTERNEPPAPILCTPETIDLSLNFLSAFPDATPAYDIKTYLEEVAPAVPEFPDRLMENLTQAHYRRFCRLNKSPHDNSYQPHSWSDSGHWRILYPKWIVADLAFDLKLIERLLNLLNDPPAEGSRALSDIHYLILYRIWQNGIQEPELLVIGNAMRMTRGRKGWEPFYDRCVFILSDRWENYNRGLKGVRPTTELARMATEAFIEQCVRYEDYRKKHPAWRPTPLLGMDLDWLTTQWPLGPEAWSALWSDYESYVKESKSPPRENDAPPLTFLPLKEAASLAGFAIFSEPTENPEAMARWTSLLRAVQVRFPRAISTMLRDLPEERRRGIAKALTDSPSVTAPSAAEPKTEPAAAPAPTTAGTSLSFENEFLQKCGFPVRLQIESPSFGQDALARTNFMTQGQTLILTAIAQLCQDAGVREKLSQKLKTIYVRNVSLAGRNRISLGGGSLDLNGIWGAMDRVFTVDDLVKSIHEAME